VQQPASLPDVLATASPGAEPECAALGAPLLPVIFAEPKMSSSVSPAAAAAPWPALAFSFLSPPHLPSVCCAQPHARGHAHTSGHGGAGVGCGTSTPTVHAQSQCLIGVRWNAFGWRQCCGVGHWRQSHWREPPWHGCGGEPARACHPRRV